MITNIESNFAQINHLSDGDWCGVPARLGKTSDLMSTAVRQLGETPEAEKLRLLVSELGVTLVCYKQVSKVVDAELAELSTAFDGLMHMLDKLDSEPLPASSLYCLMKPLALQLGKVFAAHNALAG